MMLRRNLPNWERRARAYREPIALGVAFTTQCAYCIDTHTRQAHEAGASNEEIAEAAFVAAASAQSHSKDVGLTLRQQI